MAKGQREDVDRGYLRSGGSCRARLRRACATPVQEARSALRDAEPKFDLLGKKESDLCHWIP